MNKKNIILLLFLLIVSCQNNSTEITNCNVNTSNGIGYVDGKIYTGTCNLFFNDSILWKTRSYKNGKLIKEVSYHLPGGELEYIGNSKDGEVHGNFISYYRNGNVSIEGKMKMGYYDGVWKYYDEDGSLNKTLTYKNRELTDSIFHKN